MFFPMNLLHLHYGNLPKCIRNLDVLKEEVTFVTVEELNSLVHILDDKFHMVCKLFIILQKKATDLNKRLIKLEEKYVKLKSSKSSK